jgi:hypothetical protein
LVRLYARCYTKGMTNETPSIDTEALKKCSKCKIEKPLDKFGKAKRPAGVKGDGKHYYCKECQKIIDAERWANMTPEQKEANNAKKRAWRDANREREIKTAKARRFKITVAELNALEAEANGHCSLCGKEAELHVDHDHVTGKVRNLLCHNCNVALGHFFDNPELMEKAAAYVRHHQEVS